MVLTRNDRSGHLEDYELIGIDHVAKLIPRGDTVEVKNGAQKP